MNLKVGQKIYCIKSELVYRNDKQHIIKKGNSYNIIGLEENKVFYIYGEECALMGYDFDEFNRYFITNDELRLKKLNCI
ncbi:hypothetical protein M0Q50_02140 [bacterium]|jgi:hypothetical protein|nr:hypothetical protein [bacterium]